MLDPDARREAVYPGESACLASVHVVDGLDDPVIVRVADRRVAVAADLVGELGDGRDDAMRVQVATSLLVNEAHSVAVDEISELAFRVEIGLVPRRRDDPVVVRVSVVLSASEGGQCKGTHVAGNLLLKRADGVGLDVRVKQSTAVAHILERDLGAEDWLERIVGKVIAGQMGLEER